MGSKEIMPAVDHAAKKMQLNLHIFMAVLKVEFTNDISNTPLAELARELY